MTKGDSSRHSRGAPLEAPNQRGENGSRPHKQAGLTPESRARQLANLKPQMAAVKHGAYSAERLKPVRARVLAELAASFPAYAPIGSRSPQLSVPGSS